MKSHKKVMILIVAFLFIASIVSFAKEKPGAAGRIGLAKVAAGQPYILMNANNVTSWVHPDGFFNWLVSQSWNGEFPRGSGVGTIFAEGVVFGGLVNDGKYAQTLRVTGDTYFVGMQPGAMQRRMILMPQVPEHSVFDRTCLLQFKIIQNFGPI